MKYDLSILIPARNEMFLARTVKDIVENKRGKTEVIVVLDGQLADPGIEQHPDVTVVFLPESIGQRAATNLACRLSKAKYIAKTDAHCAFDEGFDVKLMEDMADDVTMVPTMRNLHAFDWVCKSCSHRRYQGKSGTCPSCGGEEERDVVWIAKTSPQSNGYRFDSTMHFQYWKDLEKRQEGDVIETLSLQGSFFMLTREKYWESNICDEEFGSWGQQGVEVACKTWLSGGRVLVNKKTWYAHMFRTQGGDFSFPYPQSGTQISKAREYSRELFQRNGWKGAKHSFEWLLDRFAPVPDWHDKKKGILYYTDNRLNVRIAKRVQKQLESIGLPITSVSLKPMPHFGNNIHLPLKRGYLTMAKQILAGLKAMDAEYVFFCEHDVLYHPTHFHFNPEKNDVYYYNTNVWKVRQDGLAVRTDDCRQLSGLCANREFLVKHFTERVRRIEQDGFSRKMGFEPGTHNRKERIDDFKSERWESEYPNIDIRHDNNLTDSRWSPDEFRNEKYTKGWQESTISELSGWDELESLWQYQ